jgi:hypothetical protein
MSLRKPSVVQAASVQQEENKIMTCDNQVMSLGMETEIIAHVGKLQTQAMQIMNIVYIGLDIVIKNVHSGILIFWFGFVHGAEVELKSFEYKHKAYSL